MSDQSNLDDRTYSSSCKNDKNVFNTFVMHHSKTRDVMSKAVLSRLLVSRLLPQGGFVPGGGANVSKGIQMKEVIWRLPWF